MNYVIVNGLYVIVNGVYDFMYPENGLFSMAREKPLKIRFIIFGDFSLAVKNTPLLFSADREKLLKIKKPSYFWQFFLATESKETAKIRLFLAGFIGCRK
jgi:hypothetical protein